MRQCERCKTSFNCNSNNQKYCETCRPIMKNKYMADYYRRKRDAIPRKVGFLSAISLLIQAMNTYKNICSSQQQQIEQLNEKVLEQKAQIKALQDTDILLKKYQPTVKEDKCIH